MADGAAVRKNGTGDRMMKPLLRALALGVGPVVLVMGIEMFGQFMPTIQEITPPSAHAAACMQPPVFKIGYQREANGVIPNDDGYKFNGMAWVQANLCSAGILKITANGELAGDELPQLTVMQDDRILGVFSFDRLKTVKVEITKAGTVYLAYLNDYYLSDARVAMLSNISLIGTDCKGLSRVVVPQETGGSWDASSRSATLVASVAMTITPCSGGQLSVQTTGRAGKGIFPELIFQQDGRKLSNVQTKSTTQTVRISVSASPIKITLVNPYFEQLADRNLDIRLISFSIISTKTN